MNIKQDTLTMLAESGWTQQRLAKESGIHPTNLNAYLKDKRKPSLVEKLLPFVYGEKRPLSSSSPKKESRLPDYTDSAKGSPQ